MLDATVLDDSQDPEKRLLLNIFNQLRASQTVPQFQEQKTPEILSEVKLRFRITGSKTFDIICIKIYERHTSTLSIRRNSLT